MKLKIFFIALFVTTVNVAGAQDEMPTFGKDSLKCIENLSLYAEYYKQDNFQDALPHWRYVFFNCPKARKSTYIRGEKMYMDFADAAKDTAVQRAYGDTLQYLLAQRIKYFGEEGFVKGKMGLFEYKYNNKNYESAYKHLARAIELEKEETNPNVLYTHFIVVANLYKEEKRTKEDVINIYDELSGYIEKIITKGGENIERGGIVKENIEAIFSPIANCEDLGNIYGPKIKENPNDTLLLKKVIGLLSKKECYEVPFYLDAVEKLHVANPKASYAKAIGKMKYKSGDVNTAVKFMKQAIELETNDLEKAQLNLELAVIYFGDLKDYPAARTHARKAAALNPEWGEPYILIGDIYVSSVSSCDEQKDKWGVFWAAADQYGKAKSVDSSVAERANEKIGKYASYYPEKGEAFFHNLQPGESYTITCWIGETTTVKVK